jgi:hypothetical protein
LDFSRRCLPPIEPFVIRWEHPLFGLAPELDPQLYLQFKSMSTNQPAYDPNEFVVYNGILLLSLDSLGAHFAWIGLDRVSSEPVQTSARICLEWLSQSPRERQKPDLVIDEMVELLRQCQPSDFSSQVAAWLRSLVGLRQIGCIASAWGAVLLLVDDDHLAALR